jgi:hypothetical protein
MTTILRAQPTAIQEHPNRADPRPDRLADAAKIEHRRPKRWFVQSRPLIVVNLHCIPTRVVEMQPKFIKRGP